MSDWISPALPPQVEAAAERALASGALYPVESTACPITERGLPLCLLQLSSTAQKDLARATRAAARQPQEPPANPFLPFDRELWIADIADPGQEQDQLSARVLLLNKYPSTRGHVLLITRDFVEQTALPQPGDFIAIARLLRALPGVVFYNGGRTAGASQAHRHVQLYPRELPLSAALREAAHHSGGIEGAGFRHAVLPLNLPACSDARTAGASLQEAFNSACARLGLSLQGPQLPPCNLLISPDWLLLVPRTREFCHFDGYRLSLNALAFGGLVLTRSSEQFAALQRYGALRALEQVTTAD